MLSLQEPGPRSFGVAHEGNGFFSAFVFLSKNLAFKKVVPPSFQKNPNTAKFLSNRMVLPKTKIPFSSQDGSVDIDFVAQYLGTYVEKVKEAAFPEEGHKERVIMFELISYSMTETQIAAPGGGMVFKFYHSLVNV